MRYVSENYLKNIDVKINIPGDKSISHRAIILSSILSSDTIVKNILYSEDVLRTISTFEALGVKFIKSSNEIRIISNTITSFKEPDRVLYMGNSGTSTRLLTGLLASLENKFFVLTGDESLSSRPMKRIVNPIRMMKGTIYGRAGSSKLPLAILGRRLVRISFESQLSSAQVKSALILASLNSKGVFEYSEHELSRDHTERMLEFFEFPIYKKGNFISIKISIDEYFKNMHIQTRVIRVPGDISSSAFFIVLGLILKETKLILKDVGVNPTRTGVIDILRKMGANITIINKREINNEEIADIEVVSSSLKGITIDRSDYLRAIDEIPIIAIAATFASGKTILRNAAELRVKESDRIKGICKNLSSLGIEAKELDNGFIINGNYGKNIKQGEIHTHFDHRIAMSFIILSLASQKKIIIDEIDSIATSFPNFFEIIKKLDKSS